VQGFVALAQLLPPAQAGDALVAVDSATLLETEETLGRLLAVLTSQPAVEHRAGIEALVRRARAGLQRCRTLGASFHSVARVRLPLCTGGGGYGRNGEHTSGGPLHVLRATV